MYPIENISLVGNKRGSERKELGLDRLKVGQSFLVPFNDMKKYTLRTMVYQHNKKNPQTKFSCRQEEKGTRIGKVL